jgi:hypothetical protein
VWTGQLLATSEYRVYFSWVQSPTLTELWSCPLWVDLGGFGRKGAGMGDLPLRATKGARPRLGADASRLAPCA